MGRGNQAAQFRKCQGTFPVINSYMFVRYTYQFLSGISGIRTKSGKVTFDFYKANGFHLIYREQY